MFGHTRSQNENSDEESFQSSSDIQESILDTTSTRESVVNTIKSYITIENELKHLAKLAREKRKKKKELTQKIIDLMKDNELETIDTNSGKLMYSQRKTKKVLNKDTLFELINKYSSLNSLECKKLSNDILENREIKYTDILKFKEK